MSAKLFVVHGSHPCLTVEQALHIKRVPFSKIELPAASQPLVMRALFGQRTVPAIRFEDGSKVQSSRAIVRELERRVPEPALYGGPEIDEAERWGDETYQPVPRKILWPAFKLNPGAMYDFQKGARMPPLPRPVVRVLAPGILAVERTINRTGDEQCRAAIAGLPSLLDHVDALIAAGTLDGETPNAADLQIAPTTRLLHAVADLQPLIAGRPCEQHAFRWLGPNLAEIPAGTLPADWVLSAQKLAATTPDATTV